MDAVKLKIGEKTVTLLDTDNDHKVSAGDKILVGGREVDAKFFLDSVGIKLPDNDYGKLIADAKQHNNMLTFNVANAAALINIPDTLEKVLATNIGGMQVQDHSAKPMPLVVPSGGQIDVLYAFPSRLTGVACFFLKKSDNQYSIYKQGERFLVIRNADADATISRLEAAAKSSPEAAKSLADFRKSLIRP